MVQPEPLASLLTTGLVDRKVAESIWPKNGALLIPLSQR